MPETAGAERAEPAPPRISVVIPMRNEEGNVAPLIAEIAHALEGEAHEIIAVNDGSTDETGAILSNLRGAYPQLRVLHHAESLGQSAAIRDGARLAHGAILCTLDGDGQNNPAFLPAMIRLLDADPAIALVQGQRVGRTDTGFKKFQSKIANTVRGAMLKDGTRDSGCGLKVMRRAAYLRLPYFDALHRFTPALMVRDGHKIAHLDVVDRPRGSGVSNYASLARAKVALGDLIGVWWLVRRRKPDTPTREET
ncbi:MAG: glycosyltransferase family 2 protein [Methylobacterium sp.]|jgi:glycosyltransferase involved in cell wall biosynthesis|nr:glycosyltransferase family 2 protein [Methylobacterium sp.]MCA3600321.1 glycosyltransferase family 2 protein [Methylobacterium sp.]MCA3605040.1 glycosyltransferase family 2 protein [Methylobacterium sp.]MCA3609773.1 glycosyltransferase family 2 protein [Methylobacterium sp.]MCA3611544.1 glycosyltransferase family 2 protein [Methylobacterium sp.]